MVAAAAVRRLSLAAVVLAVLSAAAPATAAGTFGCSASAGRLSVLGGAAIEPTTANRDNPVCAADTATLSDPATALGLPVSASAVAAATTLDATANTVTSAGGIAGLQVLALPTIPGLDIDQITAPASAVVNNVTTPLNAIAIPLPGAVTTALTGLGLSPAVTADATAAVQQLVPAVRSLAATPLLGLQTAMAYANAACGDGADPTVSGRSTLAGLTIAGQTVPTDAVAVKTLSLLPPVSADFSKASASLVILSSNVATLLGSGLVLQPVKDALTSAINSTLTATLAALPTVSVPALTATVTFAPGQTVRSGNSVTQQAAGISATVAGIPIVSAIVGEAKASADDVDCSVPAALAPSTPTAATLQCTTRKLVLVDVLQHGDRVRLTGVADTKYVGRTVSIVFAATGRVVAHATVAKDGSFATTAPLPPAKVRDTNLARYTAKIGGERSLDLKLRRRMIVDSMTSHDGRVTIAGRVVGPLGRPVAPITLTQRVSCTKSKVVKSFRPDADGTFRITVAAPRKQATAVYRLSTVVLPSARSHRLVPTFTLPRAVELQR